MPSVPIRPLLWQKPLPSHSDLAFSLRCGGGVKTDDKQYFNSHEMVESRQCRAAVGGSVRRHKHRIPASAPGKKQTCSLGVSIYFDILTNYKSQQ